MDRLKKTRSTLKAKFTRLSSFLDGITEDNTPDREELISRLSYLETAWTEYDKNHEEIITELKSDDDIEDEEEEFAEFETKYFSLKSKLKQLIQSCDSNSTESIHTVVGGPTIRNNRDGNVKLPRLELPQFSGNIQDWTSFQDLFTSMVHNQPIDNSRKLQYLKTAVKGEAASLIQSIEVTNANYEEAWKLLQDRYQNERQLVQSHLQSLFHLSSIKEESSVSLQNLIDNTTKCVRALHVLGQQTDEWDALLVFMTTDRMDPDSRRQWELHTTGTDYPKFADLKKFIVQRCRALDASSSQKGKVSNQKSHSSKSTASVHHTTSQSTTTSCVLCVDIHPLYQCSKFNSMDVKQRSALVRKSNLCFNCLRANHSMKSCLSKSTCRKCGGKHHTMLHQDPENTSNSNQSNHAPVTSHFSDQSSWSSVLLSTAIAQVRDSSGGLQQCRILIDGGSQASFMTEACLIKLGLKRSKANVSINGIGQSGSGKSRGKVTIDLLSCHSSFSIPVDALILSKITGPIPSTPINTQTWIHLDNLNLADPSFGNPGPIDLLLGADVSDDILTHGKITGPDGYPAARNTHLGWIVSGKVQHHQCIKLLSHIASCKLDVALRRFWEIEDLPNESGLSKEEQDCEEHFQRTCSRTETGRYITSLPFKSNNIGFSKGMALRRLQQIERKLAKDPNYRKQYEDFMQEYLDLGHMELIPVQDRMERVNETNYIPHHFVTKDSTTTHLRVVFDASVKTSNGLSLNNNLMVGPNVQDDMYNILLRFRLHKYAFTADIAKMYRQVKVTARDSDFLRILWRKDFTSKPEEYRLLTVTYGTSSAPFTATRTLHQIANDDGHNYPLATEIIKRDFYVDDLMSSCNDLDKALLIQAQLIGLLDQGGFSLRKWSSNDPSILEAVPEDFRETKLPVTISSEDSVKALGLRWNTGTDSFSFVLNLPPTTGKVTKRVILSETAKLYDPLGLLSPIIIKPKILLQQLWTLGLNWDEELPTTLLDIWVTFRQQLFDVQNIIIPRMITLQQAKYQLHGFGDASERAYAAVVYLRSELPCGSIQVQLISSKTRVAPIKQISIPKLELCGAVLVSKLMTKIAKGLQLEFDRQAAWTDSTITLGWISGTPNKWKTFVANRVSMIQNQLSSDHWGHVPGLENPADLASRGTTPDQLQRSCLWWNGPSWLSQPQQNWPAKSEIENVSDEIKHIKPFILHTTTKLDIMERFSSLTTLLRVTCRIFRFISRTRKEHTTFGEMLSTLELKEALNIWIRQVQETDFNDVIKCLKTKTPCSRLASLSLFLDNGIIRVGGRLRNSDIPTQVKYPVLLPKSNHLTTLIIRHEHFKLLHGGTQLMMSSLSQRYWVISAGYFTCVGMSEFRSRPPTRMIPLSKWRRHTAHH